MATVNDINLDDIRRPTEREQLQHVMRYDDIDDWCVRFGAHDDDVHDVYYTDNPPSFCRSNFPDWYRVPYRTVYAELLSAGPRQVLVDANDGTAWDLVASHTCSGAAECPFEEALAAYERGETSTKPGDYDLCPWCEASKGEPHGEVYLGDGWHQLVYRKRVIVWGEDSFDDVDEVIDAALQVLDEVGAVTVGGKRYVFSLTLVVRDPEED